MVGTVQYKLYNIHTSIKPRFISFFDDYIYMEKVKTPTTTVKSMASAECEIQINV